MRGKRLITAAAAAAATLALASQSLADGSDDADLVQQGEYLVKAADCQPCHTADGGKPFAGGLPVETPFGAIYSPNITSDPKTGIGSWSYEDFRRVLHKGIGPGHEYLYPAMPFDAYTGITENDLKTMWAYVRRIPAVEQPDRGNDLSFPFNVRYSLVVWRELYFEPNFFKSDPKQSKTWNRGAYLVEALAHCGDCHTPRNVMGATIGSEALAGANLGDWYAPDVTTEALKNLDGWTPQTLAQFLKTGSTAKSTALGPMATVVHDSLAYLTDQDLEAIATYLLDGPVPTAARAPQAASPMTHAAHDRAAKLYVDNCMACHQDKGTGLAGSVPPLASNPVVLDAKPYDVIRVILDGVPAQGNYGAMPAFAGSLSDQDIADLANYVRTSWGNRASLNATPEIVAHWRDAAVASATGSEAAAALQCPQVGGAGADGAAPDSVTALQQQMQSQGLDVAQLVALYQRSNPNDSDLADAVNALITAYCPLVAKEGGDAAEKQRKLTQFSREVAGYISDQKQPQAGPRLGIIWALPAGSSLTAEMPSSELAFACPADDGKLVPQGLVTAASAHLGTPGPIVPATEIKDLLVKLQTTQAAAKPADLANGLILAYCTVVNGNAQLTPAQKGAAVSLFGQNVIEALQNQIEAARSKTAAK